MGAFGRPERGYHSELKCLMNGTHENGKYFCTAGMLTLRPAPLLQLLPRTDRLPHPVPHRTARRLGPAGLHHLAQHLPPPFWQRFAFTVPTPVPQTVRCEGETERPVYEACVP